jgi:hypothetical protein
MTNKEAKETLDAIDGFLMVINMGGDLTKPFKELIQQYREAKEMAKEALDIMDRDIRIEKKGGK